MTSAPSAAGDERTAARYQDEDCRPTSRKELLGFYAYSCAAEAVVIAAVSSFIPITLEQLAREHGVLQSDRTTPCTGGGGPAPAANNSSSNSNPHVLAARSGSSGQCVVRFLGADVNTASFAMYTFSVSVLLQALLVITMSGAADHGRYRKTLLLGFAFTGAVATMLFLVVTSDVFALGALWAIVVNVCLGASFVLLNAYLPLLVRWHPEVLQSKASGVQGGEGEDVLDADGTRIENDEQDVELRRSLSNEGDGMIDSTARLLPSVDATPSATCTTVPSPELKLSTKISSYGIGFGYLAALLVQILAICVVIASGSTTFSLRLVLFGIGAWWFLLT